MALPGWNSPVNSFFTQIDFALKFYLTVGPGPVQNKGYPSWMYPIGVDFAWNLFWGYPCSLGTLATDDDADKTKGIFVNEN